MANPSIGRVPWRWLVCLGLTVAVFACSKPAVPEKTGNFNQDLLSYQPLADKLQEIITAAYDPGPINLADYERVVQELAEAAEQRTSLGPESSQAALKLEAMVDPLLANHQATLNAAKNLAEESELIQKYRDGEKLPGNPELEEAVARAFPDGPPPPNELGPFGKFTAADAMIDVKWEHVRKTRIASQAFLDAFKQLKKDALLTDS